MIKRELVVKDLPCAKIRDLFYLENNNEIIFEFACDN